MRSSVFLFCLLSSFLYSFCLFFALCVLFFVLFVRVLLSVFFPLSAFVLSYLYPTFSANLYPSPVVVQVVVQLNQ